MAAKQQTKKQGPRQADARPHDEAAPGQKRAGSTKRRCGCRREAEPALARAEEAPAAEAGVRDAAHAQARAGEHATRISQIAELVSDSLSR